jgi:hypothetical protein
MESSQLIPTGSETHSQIIKFMKSFYHTLNSFALYPDSHPRVQASLENLNKAFGALIELNDKLAISTIKTDLLFNAKGLENPSPEIKHFAQFLFKNRISSIVFEGDLSHEHIKQFMVIIANMYRVKDDDYDLNALIQDAEIPNIAIKRISYRDLFDSPVFNAAEFSVSAQTEGGGDGEGFSFVNYLKSEAEKMTDDDRQIAFETAVDPSSLKSAVESVTEVSEAPVEELVEMVERLGFYMEKYHHDDVNDYLKNLAQVISSLDPDLCINILGHALERAKRSKGYVERSVNDFTSEMLKKIVVSLLKEQKDSSSDLLNVFKRLASQPESNQGVITELSSFVNKDAADSFSPDFLKSFNELILKKPKETPLWENQLKALLKDSNQEASKSAAFIGMFQEDSLIRQLCQIQMDIIRWNIKQENLETIHTGLQNNIAALADKENPVDFLSLLLEFFTSETFYLQYFLKKLDGLATVEKLILRFSTLSKELQDKLIALLFKLGNQSITLLIDALAKDSNMVNRKKILSLLIIFAPKHVSVLVRYLRDSRWFLVRNIVYILGEIKDSEASSEIIRVLNSHSHEAVVKEAIIALGKIGCPESTSALLSYLGKTQELYKKIILRMLLSDPDEKRVIVILDTLISEKTLERNLMEEALYRLLIVIKRNNFGKAVPYIVDMYKDRKKLFNDPNRAETAIIDALHSLGTDESLKALEMIENNELLSSSFLFDNLLKKFT